MKRLLILTLAVFCLSLYISCDKEKAVKIDENLDYFTKRSNKPKEKWNELDYLCDSIQKEFGVEVIYEFSPRIIEGTTFFVPAEYEAALQYTRVMLVKMWLNPLKERFPKFYKEQTPTEFIIVGGFVHFNDITTAGTAAGAGLNAQYYRLGMGGVNAFSKTNKAWLEDHLVTLYHEHAHQIDHKYGRGVIYDRTSQGDYYGLAGYSRKPDGSLRTDEEAQKDGFFKPYGGYAREEDFATSVEYMVKYPKNEIEVMAARNAKLNAKYKLVLQKYSDMGVDLHELQKVVDSVVNKVNY